VADQTRSAPRKSRKVPVVWSLRRREAPYRLRGIRALAGVDEVGVAPLAGPVVAAAVIMPEESAIRGVNDSKQVLDAEVRADLAHAILDEAIGAAIGISGPREIDRINIYWATLEAMRRAVSRLEPRPELVLVDARTIPSIDIPQEAHIKGDEHYYQIACASLLAKHFRDTLMRRLDRRYPGYGFAHHKGYPTPEHREALKRLGPCWIHRRHFRTVADCRQETLDDLWNETAAEPAAAQPESVAEMI
jgi:ribonuclease HII